MADLNVTLEHIRQAAEWAEAWLDNNQPEQPEARPLDGHLRRYDQAQWDCGTACCIWGAAHLLATGRRCREGPSYAWARQSELHDAVWSLLIRADTQPTQVLELLQRSS